MCVFCCAQRRLRALCCFRANHEKNASHTVGRVTPGHMKMKAQRADEKQEADESERQTAKVDKENEDRWVRVANCCVLSLTYFLLFFCLSYFLAHSLSSPFIWHKERIRAIRLENDSHHFSNPPIFHLVSSFRAERAALFLCHSLGEPTMQLAFHFIVSQSNNLLLSLSYFSFNEGYIKFGATAENLIGFLPQEKQSLGCM